MYFDATLITLVTDHCNNNCKYCANLSPYFKKYFYDLDKYITLIKILEDKQIFFKNQIAITGGEPTLHNNIIDYIIKLKNISSSPLRLSTNGHWIKNKNYLKYEQIFSKLDVLLFSIYPNLFPDNINDKDIIEFKKYIECNFNNISLRFEDRSYMNPWSFSEDKIIRNYQCNIYNNCLGLDIFDNKIYRCINIYNIINLFKRNKNKDINLNLNQKSFLNNINLNLDSINIDDNLTFDKFNEWLNLDYKKTNFCYYCTYGLYKNMNKYYNFLDKDLKLDRATKNKYFGVKWESLNNE